MYFPLLGLFYTALLALAAGSFGARPQAFPKLSVIKTLYVAQLILNWSWTPLFFHYHLTGLSLVVLGAMDILVCALICLSYRKMQSGFAAYDPLSTHGFCSQAT
jgi:tryptophan-rich sensory protein